MNEPNWGVKILESKSTEALLALGIDQEKLAAWREGREKPNAETRALLQREFSIPIRAWDRKVREAAEQGNVVLVGGGLPPLKPSLTDRFGTWARKSFSFQLTLHIRYGEVFELNFKGDCAPLLFVLLAMITVLALLVH
jgi:hypothetical protein